MLYFVLRYVDGATVFIALVLFLKFSLTNLLWMKYISGKVWLFPLFQHYMMTIWCFEPMIFVYFNNYDHWKVISDLNSSPCQSLNLWTPLDRSWWIATKAHSPKFSTCHGLVFLLSKVWHWTTYLVRKVAWVPWRITGMLLPSLRSACLQGIMGRPARQLSACLNSNHQHGK